MGLLTYPLKMIIPFYAQAANHPLTGDLIYADGSTLSLGTHNIDGGGAPYPLPDVRNRFLLGADRSKAIGESGQYILYVVNAVASGDSYVYRQLANLINYTIQSGDTLQYDIYLPSGTIPAANPAADLEIESSGDGLRFHGHTDQNGIGFGGDCRSYATDQWYTRQYSLSGMVGQTIVRWLLFNGYDGTYSNLSVRYQNLCIVNSGKIVYRAWTGGDGTPPTLAGGTASSTFVSANASANGAPGPDGIPGTHSSKLLSHNVPSHTHTASTSSDGAHSHSVSISGHSSHTHSPSSGQPYFALGNASTVAHAGSGYSKVTCYMATSGGAGSHTHTVSPSNAGSHSHTITITTATNSGINATSSPFDARPRWYGLVYTLKSGKPTARHQSVPLGSILMYFADAQNETLPAGVAYCDGTSYTAGTHDVPNAAGSTNYTLVVPDLRNRFTIGADRTLSFNGAGNTDDGPSGAPGPGRAEGTHSLSITVAQLADHAHAGSADTQWASHNHTWTISANGNHTHGSPVGGQNLISSDGSQDTLAPGGLQVSEIKLDGSTTGTTTSDAHSHTVDTGSAGSHSHTITINTTGSNSTWDNRPPFIGLVYVIKYKAGSLLSVPLKTVVAMRQRVAGESIPTGWAVMDGTTLNSSQQDINPGGNYTLPNFVGFFPIGCDRTKVVGNTGGLTDTAADAPGPKGTGGSHSHSLTSSEMPQHSHVAASDSQGSHTHGTSIATSSNAGHSHSTGCHTNWGVTSGTVRVNGTDFTTDNIVNTYSSTLGLATQPAHPISGDSVGSHTHTITVTAFGTGNAFSQRPRTHGVVYLMKVMR